MAQIATITKYGIPVFERSDVGSPTVGVTLDDGTVGYLNLVRYPNRDLPAMCFEIAGERYGTKRSIYRIIDDWEDNNNNEYYIPSSSGRAMTVSAAALVADSDYGLRCDGPARLFSMPGDGLPYYPQRGDTFEFHVCPRMFRDEPAFWRMNFGARRYDARDVYRVEMESEPTAGSDISLEKRSSGSNVIIRATGDNNGANLDTTYRVVVDWGFNQIMLNVYEPNGAAASPNLPLSFVDGEYDSGGISWETNGYMVADFDRCRTLPQ